METTNEIRDGGPAFPVVDDLDVLASGMTLRDYFAAQALVGVIGQDATWEAGSGDAVLVRAAGAAYEFADAMLKQREASDG